MLQKILIAIGCMWTLGLLAQSKPQVLEGHIALWLLPEQKRVKGEVTYEVISAAPSDSLRIDARHLTIESVWVDGQEQAFRYNQQYLALWLPKSSKTTEVRIVYQAQPKQAMYFWGDFTDHSRFDQQVWTQGQGKHNSHWVPSFDDMTQKIRFDLSIRVDHRYRAFANGMLVDQRTLSDDTHIWKYQMDKPMSSYLLAIAVGCFEGESMRTRSKIPLEHWVPQADKKNIKATFAHTETLMDALQQDIGVRYPWPLYRQLAVRDFLHGGMENTTTTLFSAAYVNDSIGCHDRPFTNVNAHEMAHQWFGNCVTAASPNHHWLHEGFATFYALKAEARLYGVNYLYHQLYRQAIALNNAAKTDTIPLLHPKASTLTYYQKGAWALWVLEQQLGENTFRKGMKAYLRQYAYQCATTDDWLRCMEQVAGRSLQAYKAQWLMQAGFPYDVALPLLQQNSFIRTLLEVQQGRKIKSLSTAQALAYFQQPLYYPILQEILFQYKDIAPIDKWDLLQAGLNHPEREVRQAALEFAGDNPPPQMQALVEKLLDEDSYETREMALLYAWEWYPERRSFYLAHCASILGLHDRGFRISYLALAIGSGLSDGMQSERFREELEAYCGPRYETEVRELAIETLLLLQPDNQTARLQLLEAVTYFKPTFTQFARQKIRAWRDSPKGRTEIAALMPQLSPEAQSKIQALLREPTKQ